MLKKSYILHFFFCAFALIMLSACGGGNGDEGIEDVAGTICDADPTLPQCQAATVECDPIAQFCDTTKLPRADCVPETHDCGENNQGTGALTCNNSERFCFTTAKFSRTGCEPATHDCGVNNRGTGTLICDNSKNFCFIGDQVSRGDDCNTLLYNCDDGKKLPCDPALFIKDCTTGLYDTGGVDSVNWL